MTLFAPDVSNNNLPILSVPDIRLEGFSWLECKVSEGDYFQDRTWPVYRAAAQAAGLPVIGYHYAIASCPPAAQAATFAANDGGSTVMIDFEANSGDIADYWTLVDAFNAIGVTAVLSYIPRWVWEQIGEPDLSQVPGLIASSYVPGTGYASTLYPGDYSSYWAPYGNAQPVILQFTDQADVDAELVDANAFRGTTQQIADLLSGTTGGNMNPGQLILDQLGGPGTGAGAVDGTTPMWQGWPELGGRTIVNMLGAIGAKLDITGCSDVGGAQ